VEEGQERVLEMQRMLWSLGDYSRIADFLRPVARHVVKACAVARGTRLLDVGAGTGNLAIESAHAGADVTATDLTPQLIEIGRRRTAAEGLDVAWQEADAQELPFEDDAFDVVGSVMGAMFAPDADATVQEMLRVAKPGGTVALTAWAPEGYTGQALAITSKYMPPPPPGVNTSGEWGEDETARSRFARYADDVTIQHGFVPWSFESREDARRFFEEEAPPGVAAKMALPPERYEEMWAELEALQERFNKAKDGRVMYESKYLLVVARKRS
jgi:SAM-dependent methyltransferase